ncbi:hypothetical protein ACH34I_13480 [Elizabethkingia anophelis]
MNDKTCRSFFYFWFLLKNGKTGTNASAEADRRIYTKEEGSFFSGYL